MHVRNRVAGIIEAFATVREAEDAQLIALLEALAGQLGHFIEEFAAGEALGRSEARLLVALQREQDARRAAEEASRTKDHLLAVVSHELRTPLGPIIGWARMLQTAPVTPELLARALAAIERNATLQARLVDDLLDMSRAVTGKLTLGAGLVDIEVVVQAAFETHRAAASEKRLRLDHDAGPDLPPIPGDASRLQQVVSNLLGNAIKFTPPEGRITVSTRCSGEAIELRVTDTGAGMDPALLPTIFEPFRQGHSSTSGYRRPRARPGDCVGAGRGARRDDRGRERRARPGIHLHGPPAYAPRAGSGRILSAQGRRVLPTTQVVIAR